MVAPTSYYRIPQCTWTKTFFAPGESGYLAPRIVDSSTALRSLSENLSTIPIGREFSPVFGSFAFIIFCCVVFRLYYNDVSQISHWNTVY